MIVAIIDTETTGVTPDDKMVEFGGIKLRDNLRIDELEFLVNPGIPIPPEASAVHHLTMEDVKDAVTVANAHLQIDEWLQDVDLVVAHNFAFDKRYVPPIKSATGCTFKVARSQLDVPSYSNQALRYRLGLKPVIPEGLSPHRALYDVAVTAEIFMYLVDVVNGVHNFIDISNKPTLLKKIGFGKHFGMAFGDIPVSYLSFLSTLTEKEEDFKYTVNYWLQQKRR